MHNKAEQHNMVNVGSINSAAYIIYHQFEAQPRKQPHSLDHNASSLLEPQAAGAARSGWDVAELGNSLRSHGV